MHILGLLGLLVTVLLLLERQGVDIGWLNPFAWRRRRAWRANYEANPVYSLNQPKEVTALLAMAIAKRDGDLSSDQKQNLLALFQNEFQVTSEEASGLMTSGAFLLHDGVEVRENLNQVLKPSLDAFSDEQLESGLNILKLAARTEGEPSELQQALIDQIEAYWYQGRSESKWR